MKTGVDMGVLVLSHMFPSVAHPTKGMFVVDQARALQKLGVRVIVVSPQPWSPALLEKLISGWNYPRIPKDTVVRGVAVKYAPVLEIPGGFMFSCFGLLYWACCRRLVRRLLQSQRVDLIHAHAIMPDGFAAVLLGREFNVPVVCTLHGSDVNTYPFRSRAIYSVTRWALRNLGGIVAVSDDLRNKAERIKEGGEIGVIHNGADPGLFKPISKHEARSSLNIPFDRKIVLFAGNLIPIKGVTFLLEAITQLNRPDLMLYLVGDGPMRVSLQERAERLGIAFSCVFAGRRPHDELAKWLCASDCLVLPSSSEGLPTLIVEAMICRTPVIATAVGGTPEIISDGSTGCLVPPADVAALQSAIQRMLTMNSSVLNAMLDRAENLARERLTWDANARQMLAVYRSVLRKTSFTGQFSENRETA